MRIDKTNQQPPPHITANNGQPLRNSGAEKTVHDTPTVNQSVPNIRTNNSVPVTNNSVDAKVGETNSVKQPVVSNIDSSTQNVKRLVAGHSEIREQLVEAIKLRLNSGELVSQQAAYETAEAILDE